MKQQDLEFLWIIDPKGKIYIRRIFNRDKAQFDEDLFSGLLSTISIMSSNLFNSQFQEMNIGNKLVFIKAYSEFLVILSADPGLRDRQVYDLVEEVGEAFRIQYGEYVKTKTDDDMTVFDEFGPIIDNIFGIETYIYLEEQDHLMKLLDEALSGGYGEAYTVKIILDFLDEVDDYKLDILLRNSGENLKLIMENADGLSKLQKKRYSKII